MNILHVPAQRISAQQSFVADHTSSDKMTIRVRAVDNWTCNIIEVRLLTFLECFCYRYKIVQALALITLDRSQAWLTIPLFQPFLSGNYFLLSSTRLIISALPPLFIDMEIILFPMVEPLTDWGSEVERD